MKLPVVILAGGLATRMHPETRTVPKSMLNIAGRPFIDWQLEWLHKQGHNRVILCLGHLGTLVEQHVQSAAIQDMSIEFSYDGDRPLGTGGALCQALPLLPEAFMVVYGDSYLPISLDDVTTSWRHSGRDCLMTIYRNHSTLDVSNVEYVPNSVFIYDKRNPSAQMQHIDYGLSILSKHAIQAHSTQGAFDLSDLYHDLVRSDQMVAHEVAQRFYEIGSPSGRNQTESYLKQRSLS